MVVKEVAKTLNAVPGILDRTEKLLSNIEKTSGKMGQDAAQGGVKGAIMTPFKAIEKIGKAIVPGRKTEPMK